jgi:hypothetical protein
MTVLTASRASALPDYPQCEEILFSQRRQARKEMPDFFMGPRIADAPSRAGSVEMLWGHILGIRLGVLCAPTAWPLVPARYRISDQGYLMM